MDDSDEDVSVSSEREEDDGAGYEGEHATTNQMETVTLVGKGSWNLTRFAYHLHAIYSKLIFFSTYLKGEVTFESDKYTFHWHMFYLRGHLGLGLCSIQIE